MRKPLAMSNCTLPYRSEACIRIRHAIIVQPSRAKDLHLLFQGLDRACLAADIKRSMIPLSGFSLTVHRTRTMVRKQGGMTVSDWIMNPRGFVITYQ